jgi:hypothetical protein
VIAALDWTKIPQEACPTCGGTGVETWKGPNAGSCSRCRGLGKLLPPEVFPTVPRGTVRPAEEKPGLLLGRAAQAFVVAGNAVFTAVSLRTGVRFTYRVRESIKEQDTRSFVSVLTGPENTRDYAFLGTILGDQRFVHGKKSRITPDAPSVRSFAWIWSRLSRGLELPECEIYHEGRCGKCGRPLTTPESIRSGIGPVCAERVVT